MSSSSPDAAQIFGPVFKAFAEASRPVQNLLMLHTIFGAILVPMLITMVYFSTLKQRHTPMFWFVLFDVVLGLAVACWHISVMLHMLSNLIAGVPAATYIALVLIQGLTSWTVDLTLLLRLYAVFPLSSTTKTRFIAIFSFPIAIKVARIVVTIVAGIVVTARTTADTQAGTMSVASNASLVDMATIRVDACCALADHVYVSTLFLYKLHGGFNHSRDSGRVTNGQGASITSRIRALFYIALGNLIFPVIFNVSVIAILFSRPSINVVYILPANIYMTILGVVFATVWNSSSSVQASQASQSGSRSSVPSSVWFRGKFSPRSDKNAKLRMEHGDSRYLDTVELGSHFTARSHPSIESSDVIDIKLDERSEVPSRH